MVRFHRVGLVIGELERSVGSCTKLEYSASEVFNDPLQQAEIVLISRAGEPLVELIRPAASSSPAMGWRTRSKRGCITPAMGSE